jgi:hypothetical protein
MTGAVPAQEFLAWGIAQEKGPVKGGILADEMG